MRKALARGLKAAIALIVAFACVVFMAQTYQPDEIRLVLRRQPLFELALATGSLYVLILALKAWRLKLILGIHGTAVGFGALYLVTAVFSSLAMLTPAQAGEAAKIAYLGRTQTINFRNGVSCFVFEKGLDLAAVLLLGAIALARPPNGWLLTVFALAVAVFAAAVCKLLIKRFRRGSQLERAASQPRFLIRMALISIILWLTISAAWHVIFAAVNDSAGFTLTVQTMCTSTLAILLTFVPGGLGVSEVTISESLRLSGLDPAAAQADAIMIRLLGLWWIAIGLVHWLLMLGRWRMHRELKP